nr:MAG TPA: hypothetical protein [Caudoviricetes sp.]
MYLLHVQHYYTYICKNLAVLARSGKCIHCVT